MTPLSQMSSRDASNPCAGFGAEVIPTGLLDEQELSLVGDSDNHRRAGNTKAVHVFPATLIDERQKLAGVQRNLHKQLANQRVSEFVIWKESSVKANH